MCCTTQKDYKIAKIVLHNTMCGGKMSISTQKKGIHMKKEKVVLLTEKLKDFTDEELDKVINAVNACIVVQNLEKISIEEASTYKIARGC